MGFGIKELVIILVIVILLFGTKKLKGMGSDLGGALKGFRKSMADNDSEEDAASELIEPLNEAEADDSSNEKHDRESQTSERENK